MWVESIMLNNIKCFHEQEIRFTRNPGARRYRAKPYKWITLLGENGVGKSTILQALALLLAGPEAAKELLPRPAGWVRDPKFPGKLTAVLHKEDIDTGVFGEDKQRQTFSYSYFVTGSVAVEVGTGKDKQVYLLCYVSLSQGILRQLLYSKSPATLAPNTALLPVFTSALIFPESYRIRQS